MKRTSLSTCYVHFHLGGHRINQLNAKPQIKNYPKANFITLNCEQLKRVHLNGYITGFCLYIKSRSVIFVMAKKRKIQDKELGCAKAGNSRGIFLTKSKPLYR